jgi:hypothetical protein
MVGEKGTVTRLADVNAASDAHPSGVRAAPPQSGLMASWKRSVMSVRPEAMPSKHSKSWAETSSMLGLHSILWLVYCRSTFSRDAQPQLSCSKRGLFAAILLQHNRRPPADAPELCEAAERVRRYTSRVCMVALEPAQEQ